MALAALSGALAAGALLAGCASWMPRSAAAAHADLLTQALSADPQRREQIWRGVRAGGLSAAAQLDKALMQSVPGHSGYDPAAAESALQEILDGRPSADVASTARLRLTELRTELRGSSECRQEVSDLRQRLARVVEIERRLNQDRQ